jgi:uncharacterized protein YjbI with pentapeptide repeats
MLINGVERQIASHANLSDANLSDADLRGANLSDANLSDASAPGFEIHPGRFYDANEAALADMKALAEGKS